MSAAYLFVGARQVIGHTGNLNAFQTGVLASGKPILGGRTLSGSRRSLRPDQHRRLRTITARTFEAEKRMSSGIGFHASYTLSQVRNNADSLANLADIPEGQDILGETARSRQDVRNRVTVAVLSAVPSHVRALGGFRFSGVVSVESGRPFNIFAGRDFNLDGNPNSDRPSSIGRNLHDGPAYASVDVRVGRDISLNHRSRARADAGPVQPVQPGERQGHQHRLGQRRLSEHAAAGDSSGSARRVTSSIRFRSSSESR